MGSRSGKRRSHVQKKSDLEQSFDDTFLSLELQVKKIAEVVQKRLEELKLPPTPVVTQQVDLTLVLEMLCRIQEQNKAIAGTLRLMFKELREPTNQHEVEAVKHAFGTGHGETKISTVKSKP